MPRHSHLSESVQRLLLRGQLLARCTEFRGAMALAVDWRHVAVVTHWGFIRGLTGQGVANGTVLTFDPTADATAETEDQMPR